VGSLGAGMTGGADTAVVNGQRYTMPSWAMYAPTGYGPQTTGVPQISPSIPPFLGGAPVAATGGSIGEGVGGYGTAGQNQIVAQIANQNPWNPKASPVPWAIAMLVVALLLLKHVHWRDTILEGAEEHAHAGPVSERGEESVG
jgi:hypothetical protein